MVVPLWYYNGMNDTTTTRTKQHVFEHLGAAPYRLLGVDMLEQDPNGPRCGTACDHCGTYITNLFYCLSSDGKKFIIGSTCAAKLGDEGLTKAVKTEVSNHRAAKRHAKETAERAQVAVDFEQVKATLASRPHPNEYMASKGKTMLDYVTFCGVYSSTGRRIINQYKS